MNIAQLHETCSSAAVKYAPHQYSQSAEKHTLEGNKQ